MSELTRQQFCAALGISESTVRRLELDGLPCTPVGRAKRYDLVECKRWLRENQPCQSGQIKKAAGTPQLWSAVNEYIESSKSVQRRVMPRPLKLISESL